MTGLRPRGLRRDLKKQTGYLFLSTGKNRGDQITQRNILAFYEEEASVVTPEQRRGMHSMVAVTHPSSWKGNGEKSDLHGQKRRGSP